MATVARENIGTLHDKVSVKLTKEDYMPSFEKSLKQYSKTATVPGFRKGHVPAGMVRKMAGQAMFSEEVVRSAGKKLDEYMQAEKLAIFAQPMIMHNETPTRLDINNPTDVEFTFEIGLKPEFEIPALKNRAKLTAYKITPSDKILDDEISRLTRQFGKVEEQDAAGNGKDLIYCTYEPCDYTGHVHGAKIEDTEEFDKMPAKLQEMLMGKGAGETMIIVPTKICTEEELPKFLKDPLKTGMEAAHHHYLFTLTKVATLTPLELGQELYNKVFPSSDVADKADFREKVKAELQREFDRIARERFHNEIFEMLVHSTPITLPVPFLKRWMREGGEKPKSNSEVENEFSGFEHQLRWQLISDEVIRENHIGVTRDEVKNDIKNRVLAYYGMDSDDEAPWMDGYMDKVMQDDKMADETFRRLLTDKIFLALEGKFDTELTEISEEEFFKLKDPHSMHHNH